jgi:hypothetical protein
MSLTEVASSIYAVANVDDICMGHEQSCPVISSGLEIATTRWGDIETPYNPPSLTTQPDLADISALVNKFRSVPDAPIKVRAAISGDIPDLSIDVGFDHISARTHSAAYRIHRPVRCRAREPLAGRSL